MSGYIEEEKEYISRIVTKDRFTEFFEEHIGVHKITKHAGRRQRQRGIPRLLIDLILHFGTQRRKPGDVTEIFLRKIEKQELVKHLKYIIQILDKSKGKAILESDDGVVITVYTQNKTKGRTNGKRN